MHFATILLTTAGQGGALGLNEDETRTSPTRQYAWYDGHHDSATCLSFGPGVMMGEYKSRGVWQRGVYN